MQSIPHNIIPLNEWVDNFDYFIKPMCSSSRNPSCGRMSGKSAMILCDTNILIEFYKANIAVSVITKAELLYGARDKQELAKIKL